jgi:hypothetical protein
MLSDPGAGKVSHPMGRDRISFAYPQLPYVAVSNTFVAGGDVLDWTSPVNRQPRVASPSALGRARPAHRPRPDPEPEATLDS